jgi:NitT/TauT family transport system substrate-binding protein
VPSARLSRRTLGVGAVAAATAVVTGCKSDPKKSTSSSGAVEKVVYLTGFQDAAREQYVRVADAKGYFSEVGIQVDVKPGQPSDFNTKALAGGAAQFAAVDFVSAVTNTVTYHDYRVISAVQDLTLLGVATFADAKITHASDLAGKTIGAAGPKAAGKTLFPAYAKLANLDPSTVKWQISTPDQLATLLAAHRVDAVTQYVIDQPTMTKAVGGKHLSSLAYGDYLSDLYGTVIITSSDMISRKPEVVHNFGLAISKGVRYAVDHPDEAAQIIKSKVPASNEKAASDVMTLMKPYVKDGFIDDDRAMRGIAVLASLGLITPGLTPDKLLAPVALRPKQGNQ